jgi:hypothetical protein
VRFFLFFFDFSLFRARFRNFLHVFVKNNEKVGRKSALPTFEIALCTVRAPISTLFFSSQNQRANNRFQKKNVQKKKYFTVLVQNCMEKDGKKMKLGNI